MIREALARKFSRIEPDETDAVIVVRGTGTYVFKTSQTHERRTHDLSDGKHVYPIRKGESWDMDVNGGSLSTEVIEL